MTTSALAAALAGLALVLAGPSHAATRLARLGRRQPSALATKLRALRPGPSWLAIPAAALAVTVGGWPGGVVTALPCGALAWWLARRLSRRGPRGDDPLRLAATWDLLAACLRAGLPVPTAVLAVLPTMPDRPAVALRATADLLALGADPAEAWAPARACPDTAELARAACRTARSGTALADAAADLATRARASVGDQAEARAQRAGVLVAAPLGLCFLPAFLCLGVIPVVVGLATQLRIT